MAEPVPVDELRARDESEFEFPVSPGTNEETALRFLAANPEYGWPPQKIAAQTDINPNSITKTVQRLQEKGLVKCISGRYFVDPDLIDEISGLLGDLHNLHQLEEHPMENTPSSDADIDDPRASQDEVDDLVE